MHGEVTVVHIIHLAYIGLINWAVVKDYQDHVFQV